jgi:hypothetical protein
MSEESENDMHTLSCYISLMEYCEDEGIEDIFDMSAFGEKIKVQVKNGITHDKAEWIDSYICKPSEFISSKNSIFYKDNAEIADYECEHIVETQLANGSWNIPWSWELYPEEWAVSKNWWKCIGIISNIEYLRGFDCLDCE